MSEAEPPPALERLLVSLQKSFSRVSDDTGRYAEGNRGDPISLIAGEVEFELTIPVELEPADERLLVREGGPVSLRLAGTIRHDVVIEALEGGGPEGRGGRVGEADTRSP